MLSRFLGLLLSHAIYQIRCPHSIHCPRSIRCLRSIHCLQNFHCPKNSTSVFCYINSTLTSLAYPYLHHPTRFYLHYVLSINTKGIFYNSFKHSGKNYLLLARAYRLEFSILFLLHLQPKGKIASFHCRGVR